MSYLLLDSDHFAGMTRDQWEEWLRERLFAFADNASSLVDRGRITAIVHAEAKHITDISFRALPKHRDPTTERGRKLPPATDSSVIPEVNEQDGLSPCRSGGEIRDQVTATQERAANSDFEGRLSEREGTRLLPCPFCDAKTVTLVHGYTGDLKNAYVRCHECGVRGCAFTTLDKDDLARRNWNRRVAPSTDSAVPNEE